MDVDVENQTEVIRVPQHNNVNAVEIMNDFITVIYKLINSLSVERLLKEFLLSSWRFVKPIILERNK